MEELLALFVEYLIQILIAALGLGGAGGAGYTLRRLRTLERESQARAEADAKKAAEERQAKDLLIAGLQKELVDLKVQASKVPALEAKVSVLIEQVDHMQDRLSKAEEALETERRENERLRKANNQLNEKTREHKTRIKELETENATYARAIQWLGIQITEHQPPTPEPSKTAPEKAAEGEQKADSPQKGENGP